MGKKKGVYVCGTIEGEIEKGRKTKLKKRLICNNIAMIATIDVLG